MLDELQLLISALIVGFDVHNHRYGFAASWAIYALYCAARMVRKSIVVKVRVVKGMDQ